MSKITESEIELYALEELENQGFQYLHGPAIAHDGENPLRQDYGQVILSTKLQEILPVINPQLPNEAIFQAIKEAEINTVLVAVTPQPNLSTDGTAFGWRVGFARQWHWCDFEGLYPYL